MALEDFSTDGKSTESSSNTERRDKRESFEEINDILRVKGLASEALQDIRMNHMTDYYPSKQLEDGWSYKEVAAVRCVCGERLIVHQKTKEECDCGRVFANTSRAVVMVKTKSDNQ